jgi:hypothetical protein
MIALQYDPRIGMQETADNKSSDGTRPDTRTQGPRRVPAAAFVAAPLIVAAFAYLFDVVFGTASVVIGNPPRYGVERFALVGAGWCALEAFFAAFVFTRGRRWISLLALYAYLLVVAVAMFWFGTFLI